MSKLDVLKEYIALQAENKNLWFIGQTATEQYLQAELRYVAFLIEDACEEEIKIGIKTLKGILMEE